MTLSFSTTVNGKPNYFIEKIWATLVNTDQIAISDYHNYRFDFNEKFGRDWDEWDWPMSGEGFKRHTIREDKNDRWGAGRLIHPVIKPKGRFSAGFQFAPVIKCVSVQEVEINSDECSVFIDGGLVANETVYELATNDGFETIADFFAYFNKDFTGKVIHWTDLKY